MNMLKSHYRPAWQVDLVILALLEKVVVVHLLGKEAVEVHLLEKEEVLTKTRVREVDLIRTREVRDLIKEKVAGRLAREVLTKAVVLLVKVVLQAKRENTTRCSLGACRVVRGL